MAINTSAAATGTTCIGVTGGNPVFGTAVVAGGGTGVTSNTAYAVLCGGTTSTGAIQSIPGVGSSGQVLTSNGPGALPTFQAVSAAGAFSSIVIQTFTGNGTYTPTSGMKYCIVEVVGGGGGSGGVPATTGSQYSASTGGGGGEYARGVFSAATIGASQAVTVGAGGTAGSAGQNNGGTGGTTSLGALITAIGGTGGAAIAAQAAFYQNPGVAGGTGGSGGSFRVQGGASSQAIGSVGVLILNSQGGSSVLAGQSVAVGSVSSVGNAGQTYGGGASGSFNNASGSAAAGAVGGAGIIIVTEYV